MYQATSLKLMIAPATNTNGCKKEKGAEKIVEEKHRPLGKIDYLSVLREMVVSVTTGSIMAPLVLLRQYSKTNDSTRHQH